MENQGKADKFVPISIDHKPYKAPKDIMTGAEIRNLPETAIGADLDLWQVVPGGDDIKIGNADNVDLKPGMHFYTAPKTINPGSTHHELA